MYVPSQISIQQFSLGRPQTDQPDGFWGLCTGIYNVTPPHKNAILILILSKTTVDREIFALKIIRVKNFCVIKFSRFCSIREFFLTVDDSIWTSTWRVPGV